MVAAALALAKAETTTSAPPEPGGRYRQQGAGRPKRDVRAVHDGPARRGAREACERGVPLPRAQTGDFPDGEDVGAGQPEIGRIGSAVYEHQATVANIDLPEGVAPDTRNVASHQPLASHASATSRQARVVSHVRARRAHPRREHATEEMTGRPFMRVSGVTARPPPGGAGGRQGQSRASRADRIAAVGRRWITRLLSN